MTVLNKRRHRKHLLRITYNLRRCVLEFSIKTIRGDENKKIVLIKNIFLDVSGSIVIYAMLVHIAYFTGE